MHHAHVHRRPIHWTPRARRLGSVALGLLAIIVTLAFTGLPNAIYNALASDASKYGRVNVEIEPFPPDRAAPTLEAGAHVRLAPGRIEDESMGSSNACFTLVVPLTLRPSVTSDGWDNNGPWLGFELDQLPNDIRAACEGKRDDSTRVWISQRNMAN